ncbi:endosome/lysosome-associated apoptosis and autophagy regulator family member 2-like [Xenia sp. Carnegie-2017]|uniref:endosome/lysosome-associated apoptosis and autophagy regulator family member 2-like n=1 Tax=Xenia sp. Carnegie-2017 TaxID=2897299 RepID=UPI001F04DA17|nr:endosome/lysosome-associated apoptosis and autophagy regulator family member 2-like [Xenia sp. Carnegie-2017]
MLRLTLLSCENYGVQKFVRGKMSRVTILSFVLIMAIQAVFARLPNCKKGQFEYEFTECDSAGGRWRVAVLRRNEECLATGLPPIRQKKCESSCEPGQFLDVSSAEQSCQPCPVGHYSLGGDVVYTNWTILPSGFETQSFDDSDEYRSSKTKKDNCTNSLWKAAGDYLVSSADACTSQLTLAITLKKDGYVTFSYRKPSSDVFFNVFVRNEQCIMSSSEDSYKYLPRTRNFKWDNETVHLKRGHNLIVWQASLFPSTDQQNVEQRGEPVFIKSIRVKGVAYTSECFPCPVGTFADQEGTKRCKPCPAGQFYPVEGGTECKKCDITTQYSRTGSAECEKMKPCTVNDYIETHSVCDENNKFRKTFLWIEPKICLSNVKGSTALPTSGVEADCPPCNPGMFKNGTTCDFCPPMTFSDGKGENCTKCPPSTEPEYGFDFHWWRSWPENMEQLCKSGHDRGCASGFELRGNMIDSGYGHADDVQMLLFLGTDGFKTSSLSPGLGVISFEFKLICKGPCSLTFHQLQASKKKDEHGKDQKIHEWNGKQETQTYTFQATIKHTEGYYWIFTKGTDYGRDYDASEDNKGHFNYPDDRVEIYSIKVTKTVDGGAASCKPCPLGMGDEGCIPCPKGNRIVQKDGKSTCEPCPKDTYLNVSNLYGEDACIPCGDMLTSASGSTECVSNCKLTSKEGKIFDLNPLAGFYSVKTSALFTPKGTKYYYHFNLSFCQNEESHRKASCFRNISMKGIEKNQEVFNHTICRMTMIPKRGAKPLAAQPMSVGEQLMKITTEKLRKTDEIYADKGLINATVLTMHYAGHGKSKYCPKGRSTVIHHVCDPHRNPSDVKVMLPAKCPQGTCDGCSFHVIMRSAFACPFCTKDDYYSVMTGCVKGKKNTTFVWKLPKVCVGGVFLPKRNTTTCSILERSVKDFAIGLACFAGFVILMILAILILWCKNRRLEYKYHKLIQNASDASGELPGAPQCVGDEEDDEEDVHFKGVRRKGKGFFSNIKNKFGGDSKYSDQYNFDNFSDDDIGSVEPTSKTPLS